jgi:hypothetical protein
MKLSFVTELSNPNYIYTHKNIQIKYILQKDHLFVEGSIFAWNWSAQFKEAVQALQTSLSQPSLSSYLPPPIRPQKLYKNE